VAAYIEKEAEFVRRLHARTANGDITWYKTDTDGVFQVQLQDYLVQVNQRWADENGDSVYTYVTVFNNEGGLIDSFNDNMLLESEALGADASFLMSELFENARRIAMGMEQALDDLIFVLDQEVIPS